VGSDHWGAGIASPQNGRRHLLQIVDDPWSDAGSHAKDVDSQEVGRGILRLGTGSPRMGVARPTGKSQSHPASWGQQTPLTHWLVCLEQQALDPVQMTFCCVSQQNSWPVSTAIPQPVWYGLQHDPPHTGPWHTSGATSAAPASVLEEPSSPPSD
jgi:hypothetical protein